MNSLGKMRRKIQEMHSSMKSISSYSDKNDKNTVVQVFVLLNSTNLSDILFLEQIQIY